jgi:hypothetical protein
LYPIFKAIDSHVYAKLSRIAGVCFEGNDASRLVHKLSQKQGKVAHMRTDIHANPTRLHDSHENLTNLWFIISLTVGAKDLASHETAGKSTSQGKSSKLKIAIDQRSQK